jgi:hypothetical protein
MADDRSGGFDILNLAVGPGTGTRQQNKTVKK